MPDDRIVLAPSLTWRPTNNTNWTVLGTYQKDKTGSSTAFLPHEGTLYPGPNGLIPVQRFASDPGFDKYQTETGAISSLFEHSFNNAAEGPAEPSLRPCRRHLPVGLSERLFRSVRSAKSEFSVSRSDAAHRGALHLQPRNQQGQFDLGQQRRAEIRAPGRCSHKALVGIDYRGLKERARSGSGYDTTPFDLYAPVYSGADPAGAFA